MSPYTFTGWCLNVPPVPHLRGPDLDHEHFQPCKEGSPAPLFPEDTEETPSVFSHPGELLPLCYREYPHLLCHS